MLEAIKGARKSIELEQFILGYDQIGLMFLDALKERARAGIKVRIFCDEVGSLSLARSGSAASLFEAGIHIKFFNSIIPWSPNNEALWYFRDHKKLLIIDGRIGFTGGVCLGDEMRSWRESSVQIEGPIVAQMLESFEVMWHKRYHKFKYYIPKGFLQKIKSTLQSEMGKKSKRPNHGIDNVDFQYLTSSPLPGKRYLYKELVRAIQSAKHYIYLTTPYLLPDSKLMRNLGKAIKRGVIVKILIPEKTNSRLVNIGAGTFFEDMLLHGIKIFRYEGEMIHAKTGVIDGYWSTIGSLNLDNLSLRYNFEGNIVSLDKSFAFELEKQFLNDLKISNELTLSDWRKRPLLQKILEILIWPIRKLL